MNDKTFRGKTNDGRWVTGRNVFVPDNPEYAFIMPSGSHFNWISGDDLQGVVSGVWYHVIPETICQYTGRSDCDGTKIFEHDIIYICNENCDEEDGTFEVLWDDETSSYIALGDGLSYDLCDLHKSEIRVVGGGDSHGSR